MADDYNREGRRNLVLAYACLRCRPGNHGVGSGGIWGVPQETAADNWNNNRARRTELCPQHAPSEYADVSGTWAKFDNSFDPPYVVPGSWLRSFKEDPFVVFVREVLEEHNHGV